MRPLRGGTIRGGRGAGGAPFIRGRGGNMRGAMGLSPWTSQGPQNWGNPWNQGMGMGMGMQNSLMGNGMGMNQMGGMPAGMMGMGMSGGGWGNSGMVGGMGQMGGKPVL